MNKKAKMYIKAPIVAFATTYVLMVIFTGILTIPELSRDGVGIFIIVWFIMSLIFCAFIDFHVKSDSNA